MHNYLLLLGVVIAILLGSVIIAGVGGRWRIKWLVGGGGSWWEGKRKFKFKLI